MARTLVTGATGYLGQHLLDSLLADGVPVRALVRSDWQVEELEARGVQAVLGDVTDPETLSGIAEGVNTVFHLVGGGNDGRVDPFVINTQGTRNLLNACREADLSAFVYVSSSTVYGRQPEPVDEETLPEPRFAYAQSKLEAENALLEAAGARSFPAQIARMGGMYGPDAPMLGTDLVRRGQLRITGDGQNYISVIQIDDAVRALRAMVGMAGHSRPGRVFCLADDEPVPLHTFHSHFANLLGAPSIGFTSVRRARLMIRLVKFLSGMVGRPAPLSEDYIALSTINVRMSNRRMRSELGVELAYPTYREGLAHAAAASLAAWSTGAGDEEE